MDGLPLLIGIAMAAGSAGVALLLATVFLRASLVLPSERFARLVRGELGALERDRGELRSLVQRLGSWSVGRSRDDPVVGEVRRLLARAGFRGPEALAGFAGLRALLPLALVSCSAAAWGLGLGGVSGRGLALLSFSGGALGYLVPKWALSLLAARRMRGLRQDIGTFIQMLRVLFDAGLSLERSLTVLAREASALLPDLGREIDVALRRIAAGQAPTDALTTVAWELDLAELSDLARLLRQIERHGGSIQSALSRLSDLIQDRRRTTLEESVTKLSAKMTVVMVLFLFPALLVFIGGPGFLAVIRALEGMR